MKFLLCCLFFFISDIGFSQKEKNLSNEEYLILQDRVRSLTNSNIDRAFIYANKIKQSKNYSHKAFASAAMSYLSQLKADSVKSNQLYKQAFLFLDKVKPSKEKRILKANILNYGGLIDWNQNNLKNALDKFQSGLFISKEEGDQIQIVKFNMNIALILTEVGNIKSAIVSLKESDRMTNKNRNLFSKDKFANYKSNINYYLGNCYQKAYTENRLLTNFLDSAKLHYDRAILYSKNYPITKINCKISLGNISYLKKDFITAEKTYYDILLISQENYLRSGYLSASYNLGNLFFELKKYDKALLFFQKVDSIYKISKDYDLYYAYSNYYQAKIYSIYKNPINALKYSELYLNKFEKIQSKLNDQVLEVNFRLGNVNVKKEMENIHRINKKKVWFYKFIILFFAGLFFILIGLYAKSVKRKKEADKKVNALIEDFKLKLELNNQVAEVSVSSNLDEKVIKGNLKLTLDFEKEEEIFGKLKGLENKLYYLNTDFTQQSVAKKIKTNTSYLSYVVNKRFGKSFSEYSNELKINYVIRKLMTDSKYRKYSTQALAESVGFKNAVSFTKSFSKRTGVTPIQFTKRLEEEKFIKNKN